MKKFLLAMLVCLAVVVSADAAIGFGVMDFFGPVNADVTIAFAAIGGTALAVNREAAIKQALLNKFQHLDEQQMSMDSYLRRYAPVSNSAARYVFDFRAKNNNPELTEQLLESNDLFLVSRLRYALFVQEDTTPGAINPQFYPNNQEFGTLAGSTTQDLGIFWNGKLSLESGMQSTQPMNTADFRYQPETEQASGTTFSSYPQHAGFKEVSPFFLAGNFDQKYELEVDNTGADDVVAVTNGYTTKIMLEAHGIRLFNAAEYVKREQVITQKKFSLDCVEPFDARGIRQ